MDTERVVLKVCDSVSIALCANGNCASKAMSQVSVSIREIFEFVRTLREALTKNSEVVVYADRHDAAMITKTSVMVGGYLILCERMSIDVVISKFGHLVDHFVSLKDAPYSDDIQTVFDCWGALYKSQSLGWLDFSVNEGFDSEDSDPQNASCFEIEEYLHYASPANGNVFPVVPGKIMVFPTPLMLPRGKSWVDVPHGRRFSPAFYADLFSSFEVSLVICIDEFEYDKDIFTSWGIGVEELFIEDDSNHLLHVFDRFLSLLKRAPGIVAIQCNPGQLKHVRDLIASHLITHVGLDATTAVSWVRLCCPDSLNE